MKRFVGFDLGRLLATGRLHAVAAAVVGSAVVGGVASHQAGKKQASAASSAADAQYKAAQDSIAFQRESRDLARADLAPFINFATGGNKYPGGTTQGMLSQADQTQQNFNWQAYLAANPDVAQNWIGHYGKGTPDGAWEHYQMYGQNEGRAFTPTVAAKNKPPTGYYSPDSPLGQLGTILTPEGQSAYLKNNPLFTLALNNLDRQSNNAYLGRGKLGSASNQLVNNAFLAGIPLLQNQTSNLFNAVNIGQSSAAGQANNTLLSGQNIANTIEGAGNAQASGIIGAGNAAAQGLYGIGNSLGQAAGTYAWFNKPNGAVVQQDPNGYQPFLR